MVCGSAAQILRIALNFKASSKYRRTHSFFRANMNHNALHYTFGAKPWNY